MARELSIYLLLDSAGVPLARGRLEGSDNGPNWQIRVLDDKIDKVLKHQNLKLMSITDSDPSYEGRVTRNRNDMIQIEVHKVALDSKNLRQNLRVAVRFKSHIYPVTGDWKGRREINSKDLSCGGIAFFSGDGLEVGEQIEVVIPVTSQPLILQCQLLRRQPTEREDIILYAGKFVDQCDDEEMLVREAVFALQLQLPGGGG